ncbi:hypothetical protein QJS66_01500 [Kocuria rhizophila]|nr:hypothetical protein QJS66_01500 [Kocuria rhizophila]
MLLMDRRGGGIGTLPGRVPPPRSGPDDPGYLAHAGGTCWGCGRRTWPHGRGRAGGQDHHHRPRGPPGAPGHQAWPEHANDADHRHGTRACGAVTVLKKDLNGRGRTGARAVRPEAGTPGTGSSAGRRGDRAASSKCGEPATPGAAVGSRRVRATD